MPEVPIRDLGIYGRLDCDYPQPDKSGNVSILSRGILRLKTFTSDVMEMAGTTEGKVKIGTSLASPFLGLLLVRKTPYRLVKFTTAFFTTSAVSFINFPTQTKETFSKAGNTAMFYYKSVSENQSRLMAQLQKMKKENTPPPPASQEPPHDLMCAIKLSMEEEFSEKTPGDEVMNLFEKLESEKAPLLQEVQVEDPDVEADTIELLTDGTNEEGNVVENALEEEKEDEMPDNDCIDLFMENTEVKSNPVFDFGQSIKEDEDMYSARDRE